MMLLGRNCTNPHYSKRASQATTSQIHSQQKELEMLSLSLLHCANISSFCQFTWYHEQIEITCYECHDRFYLRLDNTIFEEEGEGRLDLVNADKYLQFLLYCSVINFALRPYSLSLLQNKLRKDLNLIYLSRTADVFSPLVSSINLWDSRHVLEGRK